MTWKRFVYKLFFVVPGEPELDLGWLLLLIGFFVSLGIWILAALGKAKVTTAAWAWMGSTITMCFISGVTIIRARLIAGSAAPGAVAQGVAQAAMGDMMGSSYYESNGLTREDVTTEWKEGDPQAGVL